MRGSIVTGLCWAVLGPACGETETCESRLPGLCEGHVAEFRETMLQVDGALAVDFEGDGRTEIFAFSRDGRQVGVAQAEPDDEFSQVSAAMFLAATPTAAAAVEAASGEHEVVVALADPPGLALFGLDADGRLERRRDLALDSDPEALWAGDLDGDARSELLVAQAASGTVSWVDPASGESRVLASGSYPVAIAVGQLDGDGVLDIVVADYTRESVLVLRGAGGGEFHAAKEFAVGSPVESIELADLDGDGALDVLTRGLAEPAAILCRNEGAGELAAPVLLPFTDVAADGVGLVASPAVAGVVGVNVPQGKRISTWYTQTGDEWLGHVETYMPSAARWVGGGTDSGFLVGGDGVFGRFLYRPQLTPIELWRDERMRGDYLDATVAVGDLDADGLVDAAAASAGTLFIYRGLADGSFERVAQLETGGTPWRMLIAEVTGDEDVDVVLLTPPNVSVVKGGGFAPGPTFVPAFEPFSGLVVRTGAGTPARVAVFPTSEVYHQPTGEPSGVSILRFAGDGSVFEEIVVADAIAVRDVVSADLDGDAADEVVVFGMQGEVPVLTRWAPDGPVFVAGPQHDLVARTGIDAEQIDENQFAAGDADEDGTPEVWLSTSDGLVRVDALASDLPTFTVIPVSAVFAIQELHDVDEDGHLDAFELGWTGDFRFRRGAGDGTFAEEFVDHTFPSGVASAFAEAGAQVDLVTISFESVAAHRLLEVPRAEPEPNLDFGYFMGRTSDMAIGDINHDGADDVVTISGADNGGIAVLWGGSDEALERMDVFADAIETKGLTLADLDEDGYPEVITSSGIAYVEAHRFWPRRERIFLPLDLGSLNRVHDLAVQDVDGDGVLDVLALIHDGFGDAGELLAVTYGISGDGYPPYTDWELLLQAPEIDGASLAVQDVNGDQRADLLVTPGKSGASVLLLNEGPRAWSEGLKIASLTTALAASQRGADLLVQTDEKIQRFEVVGDELAARETLLADPSLAGARLTRAADVDGDGQYDLFVEGETDTTIWLAGGRGFTAWLRVPTSEMKRVDVGDVDGDGQNDLIGRVDGRVAVRLSGGAG